MNIKLVGASSVLCEIEQEIECAARSDAKILITGESGVGKDIVARLIHQRSRRQGPFVTINCAGVPDSLLESELFGHVRGSFTGAYRDKRGWLDQAQDGTIFLDEVGEMTLRMQALLLRFLENGEIQRVGSDRVQTAGNVRVITATNRNLVERVAGGEFREDLYYRMNVIHIVIPPLRERPEDVAPLITHFLDVFSQAHHVPRPVLAEQALSKLAAYPWPGNVRELRNIVERLVVRNRAGAIMPADLPREVSSTQPARQQAAGPEPARRIRAEPRAQLPVVGLEPGQDLVPRQVAQRPQGGGVIGIDLGEGRPGRIRIRQVANGLLLPGQHMREHVPRGPAPARDRHAAQPLRHCASRVHQPPVVAVQALLRPGHSSPPRLTSFVRHEGYLRNPSERSALTRSLRR